MWCTENAYPGCRSRQSCTRTSYLPYLADLASDALKGRALILSRRIIEGGRMGVYRQAHVGVAHGRQLVARA
jgi:hypothetical protein